jgi:class 3 adenylate cyclase/tetratricopeptide (TPR) repeat protein
MGCGCQLSHSLEPASKDPSFDEKLDKIRKYLPQGLTEKILSQRNRIEGERKQVTVMFCDMQDFTSLVEGIGPENAYFIMDQVYEILIGQVRDCEGTVNEMTGDGIMALFGAPIALEDAPQRALRSALAIHREIAKFNDRKKNLRPIKMRIGIHTGPVVVGALGNDLRVEFKAVGDTVNLASRMEGLAEPNTTYVTEHTFKPTEGLFHFEALGEKEVKGKKQVVSVYKLLSAKEDVYRHRLGFERMIYSEMVGRDKELNELEYQTQKAIDGYGSVVNIIGEAGIGKSRLIAELKNSEVLKEAALFEGRAISIGRNLSFHPIIGLLKQWLRIKKDDDEAAALKKLETALRSVCREEVNEILPFVAILMGIKITGRYAQRVKGIEGEALEKLILKHVRDLLIKASELSPLVIIMEDLHWADTSSIELMVSLFRLAETQRILFINVFRPGYPQTSEKIIETIQEKLSVQYVEVILRPLNEQGSVKLINNIMKVSGLHSRIKDQIVRRTSGNPFFIEEVVRSFIDEGALVVRHGVFELTEKANQIEVPLTVNDVLTARIDMLDENTRNLVKIASVIGRTFFYRILRDVAGNIVDMEMKIEHLKKIQFIQEQKRMQEVEFTFKHALVQETAYASLLHQKRKEIHLMVANSIEKIFSKRLHDFSGMLAYHYSIGEDFEKAEIYLIKAGEEALKSSASSEALHYYNEAMQLYVKNYGDACDPVRMAEFEENIAIAFYNKGHFLDATRYFSKALKSLGTRDSGMRLFRRTKLFFNLMFIIRYIFLPSAAKKKKPSEIDNKIINIMYKRGHALIYIDVNQMFMDTIEATKNCFRFDITALDKGVETLSGSTILFSWTGISFTICKGLLNYIKKYGQIEDANRTLFFSLHETVYKFLAAKWDMTSDEDLIDYGLKIGDIFYVSNYIIFHGWLCIEQGNFCAAEALANRLEIISEEYNHESARGLFYELNTSILMKQRKLEDALNNVEAGIIYLQSIGQEMRNITMLGMKTRILVLQNDIDGAEKSINEAKIIVEKEDIVPPYYYSNYLMGVFMYCLKKLEALSLADRQKNTSMFRASALKSARKVLRNCRKVAADRTEAFRLVGTYYWLINKKGKAVKWWSKSIEEGRRLNARLELSRTFMTMGQRLAEPGDSYRSQKNLKAEKHIRKASEMFKEMSLDWDLEQLKGNAK